ncbi:hypothetical protein, partial [Mycobacteroides abscessus]|uniref:hypothetical protein n=1 Tax=Mycobacteroides abscessus TaxID=36809 RepID=UPI001A98AA92
QAVATRRGLPSRLFLRHTCILVSKVRSLRDFQGGSYVQDADAEPTPRGRIYLFGQRYRRQPVRPP